MRNLLLFILFFILLSCKKENEIDFRSLSGKEKFDLLEFSCYEYPSNNYFKGTMGGQPFCRYQSDIDSFRCYVASGFVSTEPIISTGATPQYIELHCDFTPQGPIVSGAYVLYLVCRDTAFAGNSIGELIDETFVAGRDLPLSTQFLDWKSTGFIPPKSAIQGASICFLVYDGSDYLGGNIYMSNQIVQKRGRYIKCTKKRRLDTGGYEVELEVNVEIPNAQSGYDTKRLDMKGVFHFEIKI